MRSGPGVDPHLKRSLHDGQEHDLNDGHIVIDKKQKDKREHSMYNSLNE